MPGRRAAAIVDDRLCRRCQAHEPAVTVRNEPLCAPCVVKYVCTKVVKRMESFRVRHADPGRERVLLLPLSCGSSSTALLHVLSQHLAGQAQKTGRTGFQLHVLHVRVPHADGGGDGEGDEEGRAPLLDRVRRRYPEHTFSSCALSDVLSREGMPDLGPELSMQDGAGQHGDVAISREQRLVHVLSSLGSATSRADMTQLLLRKLVVDAAKAHRCEAVLWGDSTTRLAERTLAETAKGRGAALPWIGADGDSLNGIAFYYPMRDLLSKEIASFVTLVDPPLDDLVATANEKTTLSTRHTTIDDLMKHYFASVEREYPSIVANVVKTSGKLQGPSLADIAKQCELCALPLDGQAPERSRLCYGCIRTLPHAAG